MGDYTLPNITNNLPPSQSGWRNDGSLHLDDIGLASSLFNAKSGSGTLKEWEDEHGQGIEGGRVSERGRQTLEQAKRFDPNAYIDYDGKLVFDDSKLPKWSGGNVDQYKKYGGVASLAENDARHRMIDDKYVIHDKNYGDYTVRGNLKQAPGDSDSGFMGQLGKYMPAVVSAIMAGGMGAAAGPMIGALMSGALGPNGMMSNLTMGGSKGNLMNIIKNMAMKTGASFVPGGSQAMQAYNIYKSMHGGR